LPHYHKHRYSKPPNVSGKLPTGPAPSIKKQGFLGKIKERFREPDATEQDVSQLKLNTEREEFKTRMYTAKSKRPSRFDRILSGGQSQQPSYRRMSRQMPRNEGSFLMGDQSSSSGFLSTPSHNDGLLDMLGAGKSSYSPKSKKYQKSGFDEMFGM